MRFLPRFCPLSDCPSHSSGHHRWRQKGTYRRACDGRTVQRFLCLECLRTFSAQTFRLDYRLKRPQLHLALFGHLVSKVTHRQAARVLSCSRKAVAHRLLLLGRHCREFHREQLRAAARRGGLSGVFQLDELETFEDSRRLAPLTVPVLLERKSFFVLHASVATLPARGGLSQADRRRKAEREAMEGRRRSGSLAAVRECFGVLSAALPTEACAEVQTDRKCTYPAILERLFPRRLSHLRCSSRARRGYHNPLFPINHTLAMLRDGVSRLVRRTWAASKRREKLEMHLWIWIVWRNYVRAITNREPRVSAAMALGVALKKWSVSQLCARRFLTAE